MCQWPIKVPHTSSNEQRQRVGESVLLSVFGEKTQSDAVTAAEGHHMACWLSFVHTLMAVRLYWCCSRTSKYPLLMAAVMEQKFWKYCLCSVLLYIIDIFEYLFCWTTTCVICQTGLTGVCPLLSRSPSVLFFTLRSGGALLLCLLCGLHVEG